MHHLLEGFSALCALHVLVLTQLRVLAEELRVAAFQEITLWVEEARIAVGVDVPIEVSHAKQHVRSPLHAVLAMENQDGSLSQVPVDCGSVFEELWF